MNALAKPKGERRFDETARQVVALKCAAAAMRAKPSPMPTYRPLPPLERLQALFDYRPDTGELINRVQRGGLRPGQVAGLSAPEKHGGYVTVYADCVPFRAHRIAFKLHYGRDPVGQNPAKLLRFAAGKSAGCMARAAVRLPASATATIATAGERKRQSPRLRNSGRWREWLGGRCKVFPVIDAGLERNTRALCRLASLRNAIEARAVG